MIWPTTKIILIIGLIGIMASQCGDRNTTLTKVMDLPIAVKETSGLAVLGDKIYTHNDSGDGPYVYVIDTLNNNISRKIRLQGAKNIDWEDMATSNDWLYIGDIGNNTSSRSKYRLYKVSNDALDTSGISTIDFMEQEFTFRNAKGKKKKVNSEAMIAIGDTTYFLSKELGKSELYRLNPTEDKAHFIRKIELPFAATGWCNISENKTAICGYRKIGDSFYLSDVAILERKSNNWDNVKITGLDLGLTGQFEGICYNNGYLYLSSEGIGINNSQLFLLKYP